VSHPIAPTRQIIWKGFVMSDETETETELEREPDLWVEREVDISIIYKGDGCTQKKQALVWDGFSIHEEIGSDENNDDEFTYFVLSSLATGLLLGGYTLLDDAKITAKMLWDLTIDWTNFDEMKALKEKDCPWKDEAAQISRCLADVCITNQPKATEKDIVPLNQNITEARAQ